MFERRLKIFLFLLIGATGVLLARAAQLQIVQAEAWQKKAEDSLRRPQMLGTTRGTIKDIRGQVLAIDEPCWDAAVDYRAIERNAKWIQSRALSRLKNRPGFKYNELSKEQRSKALEAEEQQVNADIDEMWRTLAELSGRPVEEILDTCNAIQLRVSQRRRYLWFVKFKKADAAHQDRESALERERWYKRWLEGGEAPPQLDKFELEVSEESEAHVVLGNIDDEVQRQLKKQQERFPGLVVRPGKHRYYPLGHVAPHVIGHLAAVTAQEQDADPHREDDLRKYYANDVIGRTGVEKMCEELLRGARGRVELAGANQEIVSRLDPVAGADVTLTIDAMLQSQIEDAFKNVEFHDNAGNVIERHEMHGAAVVIDVASGEVRALVSYPTFDLNQYDELYPALSQDSINRPLSNRATQSTLEPGSTVKPIVGIGAITDGVMSVNDTVECTGFLVIDGRVMANGRCWTAKYLNQLGVAGVAHHQFPVKHPTGLLLFSDALERSCNVFFETVGDRMKAEGLRKWFHAFGLGRPTGIGLMESRGLVPGDNTSLPRQMVRSSTWFSSIGQTQVLATPIQMANVAATIARDGVWMRPRLVRDGPSGPRGGTDAAAGPDRVDLHVSPAAVQAAKLGMLRVVNGAAGTGKGAHHDLVLVAGKTGTAQASPFRPRKLDAKGKPYRGADGQWVREEYAISTPGNPNPEMPWYRGSGKEYQDLSHSWFIGFAPADHPKVAFAVMMEYGGGGGESAPIVKALLDACIEHDYLQPAHGSTLLRDR